ncbi:MAG: hypothetical protein IPP72_16435 [Chitinophagaceae bacterium]|nr:hypothetical protein [Chitinophagaceae bacterium]
MASTQQLDTACFPVTRLEVQKPKQANYSRLALLTGIRVFNKHTLNLNDSSLTIPEFVYNMHNVKTWPAIFNIQYRIFPLPGFIINKDGLTVFEIKKKQSHYTNSENL